MKSNLLATKFHRPSSPKRVQRPHLVQRLNDGLAAGHQLTPVSAPAGFGKTTCVSEWVSSLDGPMAWLTLDSDADDPGRFFAYFAAALQSVDENVGREFDTVLSSPTEQLPSVDSLITTLINDVVRVPHKFVLVLDDWHEIRDSAILKALEKLVANQPENMHLVLVTRENPLLPLARLRANGQMTEIRAGDLRFDSREADQFLNGLMALSLSEADVTALEDRTEGWIVGLQLAAIALQSPSSVQGRADPATFIANLSGSHRYILSYLTDHVLSRQTAEITDFLLQTSILDQLTGDLCDAVTGRTDGAALLESLYAVNLFLVPLDDEQQWYRYHHLFADLLSNRLRQTVPSDAIQALHRRTCDWLVQHDSLHEAIQHAISGKDYERSASLVEQVARRLMVTGELNTLKNWLAALPATSFQAFPRLDVYRVWIDLVQGRGDLSEQGLQEKENLLRSLPPSPENDKLRLELMVVLCRFVALMGDTPRATHLAEQALSALPETDHFLRARAQSALAIAFWLEGDTEKADRAFHECLRLAQVAGNYSLAAHTTMVFGTGYPHYGQLHKAAKLYQSIIDMGIQAGQKVFYPAGQGYIGLASIYLEWNDLETAEEYLKRGMELCRQGGCSASLRVIRSRRVCVRREETSREPWKKIGWLRLGKRA